MFFHNAAYPLPEDWKEQIVHLPNGRLFIPGDLVEPLYANGILDRISYLRYKNLPQTLDRRTNTVLMSN